jgi:hypothetical protein
MRLKLVDMTPPISDGFDVPDRDLRQLPTRPGVSQERLSLRIPADLAEAVGDTAREEGLREDAWIGLVIESERALRLAAPSEVEGESLLAHLDEVAARPLPPVPGLPLRAINFVQALRNLHGHESAAIARLRPRGSTDAAITASVPVCAVAAWQRGAIEAKQALGTWAADHLQNLPRGRLLWEAAAVEAGESLTE